MGHARPRVETGCRSFSPSPLWIASIGPRASARGNAAPFLRAVACDLLDRFNWATRVRAWKPSWAIPRALRANCASIGPRASARGNRSRHSCSRDRSYRFNWATRVRAWKRFTPQSQKDFRHASIGPRASARGNVTDKILVKLGIIASIGPRASARGNYEVLKGLSYYDNASIGPRASARGNDAGLSRQVSKALASIGPRASARGNPLGPRSL